MIDQKEQILESDKKPNVTEPIISYVRERVFLILWGINFATKVAKKWLKTNAWYKKTIQSIVEEVQSSSLYTNEEKRVISKEMENTVHWGSYFVSGSMWKVQSVLFSDISQKQQESSLLTSMFSTIFFYRLDNILDESEFFKKNEQLKSEVIRIFLEYISWRQNFNTTKNQLEPFPDVWVDILFVAQKIRESIPKTPQWQLFLDNFIRLWNAAINQTLNTYDSSSDSHFKEKVFHWIDISKLTEEDKNRIFLASNLWTLTTEVVIRSLWMNSNLDSPQFFYALALFNTYAQLTDDKWDENIDIKEGQSTVFSQLESEQSRSNKMLRYREIEKVRKAIKRKYFSVLKTLPSEQKEILRWLFMTTLPMLFAKSISKIKNDFFPK